MSLSAIIQEKQTECFNKHGVFFAFSKDQFVKQRKEGITYVSLGAGTLCPKESVDAFLEDHKNIVQQGIATDIERNGKKAIIQRELANYECYFTGDIDDCVEALEDYGFTYDEIYEVYANGA